MEKMKIDR